MVGEQTAVDVLVLHGVLMTVDAERRIITDGALAIEGSKIVAVGKSDELGRKYSARQVIDATDKLVTPGLIDGHRHLVEMTRGLIPDTLITRDWLKDWCYPYLGHVTEEHEYWHSQGIMADMIKTGTTTVIDPGIKFPATTFPAIAKAGMRAVTGIWTWDQMGPDAEKCAPHFFKMTTDQALQRTEDTISQYNGMADGRITVWATLEGVGTCSDTLMLEAKKVADRHGVSMLMHKASSIQEVRNELERFGQRPVEHMYKIGALGPNVWLNHMTAADTSEIPYLSETDTKVCQNPSAALKLAKGSTQMGKFVEMLAAGVTVALGCDGSNSSDFSDMKRAIYLAATLPKDARVDASVITAEKAVEMATIDGARAIAREKELGSLEVGKKADLVLWDMRRPEWVPTYDYVRVFVYSASGDCADTVIVDGKILMQGRRLLTMNEGEIINRVQSMRDDILQRAGLTVVHRWPVI